MRKDMMTKTLVISVIILFVGIGFQPVLANNITIDKAEKQQFNGTFMKTFGGERHDEGYFVRQTSDGGYIITGYTDSFSAGKYDVWLIKTDNAGNEEWNKTYGGTNDDLGYCVQQTADGGYIIIGDTKSFGSELGDVWLIKTDSTGNIVWDKTFGGTSWEHGYCVQQTTDSGYIITGYKDLHSDGDEVWLIKTDSTGNKEWDKTFGAGEFIDRGSHVQQTTDGGYIIAGETWYSDSGYGDSDVYLIKTDSAGNKDWDKIYGGTEDDKGFCVQQTSDGGYIITGETSSFSGFGWDAWLIKTDNVGNKEWDKVFSESIWDVGYCVQQTIDGGYIITGYTMLIYSKVFLIKTDSTGKIEWQRTFEGGSGKCIQQTTDGGYIITGYTFAFGAGMYDLWLIKTNKDGQVRNKAVTNNVLFWRLVERFPLLQKLLLRLEL